MLIPLLCTVYFAALTWGLYSVLSTPGPTPRVLLWGLVGATGGLFLLQATLGPLLGPTIGPHTTDKFFFLLKFSGGLVVLQGVNPWLRRTFARRAQQRGIPSAGTDTLLTVNAFLANKAI